LKKEEFALSNLDHPNIVKYIGNYKECALVIEYLPNGEVFDYI
jgi:hypothetical protein